MVPVLDAGAGAEREVGELRHVAGGVDARIAGARVFVHRDAVADLETVRLGERDGRQDPEPGDDELSRDGVARVSARMNDAVPFLDRGDALARDGLDALVAI